MLHERAYRLGVIARVLLATVVRERNPEDATRKGSRTTEHRLLLDHNNVQAPFSCGDGAGQAGCAGASDDEVVV